MRHCVQNSETGESFYVEDCTDEPPDQHIDEETGEPVASDSVRKVRYPKHKHFQIPKHYLRGTTFEEFEKVMLHEHEHSYQPVGSITVTPIRSDHDDHAPRPDANGTNQKRYKREDYMKMEGVHNDIIMGYHKLGYLLYLVPSLFFFNVYLGMVITCMEIALHAWAHRKNNLNMSHDHFYRSPLHILTSQYCATCRSESDDDLRVFHMLNKQMRHGRNAQTIKDLTKAIS